ncbi:phosducin-like protein [Reticulomyxa filosa]|uniref:Phosducin-like protein n=1 Tax=Reticulomyxa filosa TaxID=46433 RepID=X6M9D3_RETFI|nr:phosducin-like protein [Reticulomyxa filosa]|eukprot:ETO10613.1 phosducin-like protein [Reticulomyxa filosa]
MSTDGYSVGATTTEWHDALVKHKIIAKPEREVTQDETDIKFMWETREKEEANKYKDKTLEELGEMEDDGEERGKGKEQKKKKKGTIEELRRKRLQELKDKETAERFGRIQAISKADYTKEVTEASKQSTVVCCLFAFSQPESKKMLQCLEILAERFKECKFVKIKGQECIEDYPEDFCPTLIIYKSENPIGHIKGLQCFGGIEVISPDIVEWELAQIGVWKTQMETNPRTFQMHTKNKTRSRYQSKSANGERSEIDAEQQDEGAERASDASDLDLD